jgi:hypothetical protein
MIYLSMSRIQQSPFRQLLAEDQITNQAHQQAVGLGLGLAVLALSLLR